MRFSSSYEDSIYKKRQEKSPGNATITKKVREKSRECHSYKQQPIQKSKRKVQGVPQSQTAALPRPREEEETDKSKQAQIKQTYEKH